MQNTPGRFKKLEMWIILQYFFLAVILGIVSVPGSSLLKWQETQFNLAFSNYNKDVVQEIHAINIPPSSQVANKKYYDLQIKELKEQIMPSCFRGRK